jgi:hypothetical protein
MISKYRLKDAVLTFAAVITINLALNKQIVLCTPMYGIGAKDRACETNSGKVVDSKQRLVVIGDVRGFARAVKVNLHALR